MTGATQKRLVTFLALFLCNGIGTSITNAQSGDDIGNPSCLFDDDIAVVANIHASTSTIIFDSPLVHEFPVGDVDGDGVSDTVFVDYEPIGHILITASGSTGDVLYSMFGVNRPDYWFSTDVVGIGDADGDGKQDIMIASFELVNGVFYSDFIVINGENGSSIARLSFDNETATQMFFDVFLPEDVNKSGFVTGSDVSGVISDANATNLPVSPLSDTNTDGVVDSSDVQQIADEVVFPSLLPLEQVAIAIDGSVQGNQIVLENTRGVGDIFRWLKKKVDCVGCMVSCADSWAAASACIHAYRDAAQQCEDDYNDVGATCDGFFDYSECLDHARLNALPDCLQRIADTAGGCYQCIFDCHPIF